MVEEMERLASPTTQSAVVDSITQSQVPPYQRRGAYCCCIWRPGETDMGTGLATDRVEGSTIGIALRVLWASGWCSFICCCACWKPADVYVFGTEERSKEGVGWTCCWRGDPSGEPDDSEPLSEDEELCIDCSCRDRSVLSRLGWTDVRRTSSSVKRLKGQNISSSSNSKLLAASKTRR